MKKGKAVGRGDLQMERIKRFKFMSHTEDLRESCGDGTASGIGFEPFLAYVGDGQTNRLRQQESLWTMLFADIL